MSLSLDNDVVKKLGIYELLDRLADAFDCTAESCYVLPTLRFQLRLGDVAKATARLGSATAVQQVQTFIARAKEIGNISPEAANSVLSLEVDGLDPGEKTLLAWLMTELSHKLLTGDKRAICALGTLPDDSPIRSQRARIRCFEAVMISLLNKEGFGGVSAAVRAKPDADISLRLAFGNSHAADEPTVRSGLASYINDLVAQSNNFYVAA